ncbi:Uncharacterized protein BM_BM10425 [Brugia malayi]|uniref:Uncharacterized protein n=2 Tax=Brugia TaxID=6278 RepID=A0A4E9FL88_BRUMA|nr:Uncharacterized protein BM_BM10425 [Brugia malayi]VIO93843.1 Uncharacterized protein BM_BM10425 [Brugia malayi]
MEYILAGVATACWLVIAVKLIAHLMCFEPEDGKESVASTADEELAGMAEVDAVVTGGGGADSSWEYSEALSKSPTGHDFGTSVINKKDEPVAEDEVRFISQG